MPLRSCKKVYANVYALSPNETGALVCCDETNTGWLDVISYEGLLCSQQIKPFPLVKSMTRLPDLLLLTFVPILLRLLINIIGWISQTDHAHRSAARTSMNRLVLFLSIMTFRIFFLYVYLNLLQVFLHDQSTKGISRKMTESLSHTTAEDCWYSEFLMGRNKKCHGQQFDFSDHVVLFFAQSLPIMLLEATVWHSFPLWPTHTDYSKGVVSIPSFILNTVLSSCLSLYFGYINYVTLLVAHSTAAYFHTITEVVVGYAISLVVQIPIAILLSSTEYSALRRAFGIPSIGNSDQHLD